MTGKRALILVGLSVVMTVVLPWVAFATEEVTGIPGVGVMILLTVLVAGAILAFPLRTRLFGLACLVAIALDFILFLLLRASLVE